MDLNDLAGSPRFLGLIMGDSGNGKTGALASLLNTGAHFVRIIGHDRNWDSLVRYVKPEFRANVDIVPLEDTQSGSQTSEIAPTDPPSAFIRGVQLMTHWKYTRPDGKVVDLGRPRDWGNDTTVVLDSLTSQGRAAVLRQRFLRPTKDLRKLSFGAQVEQQAFLDAAMLDKYRFNFIAISHLKLIGPKDPDIPEKLSEEEKAVKRAVAEAQAEMVPFKYFPSATGEQLAKNVAMNFNVVLLADKKVTGIGAGAKVQRVLTWTPRDNMDLKMPDYGLKDPLDIATGLLDIYRAMGVVK